MILMVGRHVDTHTLSQMTETPTVLCAGGRYLARSRQGNPQDPEPEFLPPCPLTGCHPRRALCRSVSMTASSQNDKTCNLSHIASQHFITPRAHDHATMGGTCRIDSQHVDAQVRGRDLRHDRGQHKLLPFGIYVHNLIFCQQVRCLPFAILWLRLQFDDVFPILDAN